MKILVTIFYLLKNVELQFSFRSQFVFIFWFSTAPNRERATRNFLLQSRCRMSRAFSKLNEIISSQLLYGIAIQVLTFGDILLYSLKNFKKIS